MLFNNNCPFQKQSTVKTNYTKLKIYLKLIGIQYNVIFTCVLG